MTTQERDRTSVFPSEEAKRKLTQSYAQLKLVTGIDRAVWSRYFTGKRWSRLCVPPQASPTLRQCQQVAAALELEALDFVAALLERVATIASSGSAAR